MGNHVKGKNIICSMEISSVFYPLLCAKTAEFVTEQEEIEVTSVNSSLDREYEAGMSSTTLTMTGVTTLDNTNAKVSILYLMQQAVRRQTQSFRIRLTDDDSDVRDITFSGIIRTTGFSREVLGYSNSTLVIRVTGALNVGEPIAPPTVPDCEVEDALYKDAVEGQNSVTDALLTTANVVILSVSRTGVEHYFTSGTPGSLQYAFNAGTGTITFSASIPFEAGEWVYVLYKIEP
jgi:predicted glutamine amidotransferase